MKALPWLAAPEGGAVDLLIVAGEHSGDAHAARMLRLAREQRPGLRVAAVGGPRLEAAGAQLLLDLTVSSAIGPGEVLRKAWYYRSLIREIAAWIERYRPRAVCFVDSSALNLRIAALLYGRGLSARAGGTTRTLYYVSPQIWASRAGRRFDMARHLDALATIFPFEPKCYADTALPVTFVGHPFLADDYVAPVRYDPEGPVLLLPGSRKGAVRRIFPALVAGYQAWGARRPAVVLHPSEQIGDVLRSVLHPESVELRRTGTDDGPTPASAVLTSSGTMSLECALAGLPGAIVYRADPVTYLLGRWLVRVPYLGIANILLEKPLYPEYIQGAAQPGRLGAELAACCDGDARRESAAAGAARLREILAAPAQRHVGAWLLSELDA